MPDPDRERERHPEPESLAFVQRFARVTTYGGGKQARLSLAPHVALEAIDGWAGERALMRQLALKLEDHLAGVRLTDKSERI